MSKYKGKNGILLTQGLIYEWNNPDAPFSMRDTGESPYYVARSGKKYLSLPYAYRNSVSEYDCAIKVLGSWEHWKKVSSQPWFETGAILDAQFTGLNDWRAEKKLADESKAKEVILKAIEAGDLNAAKYLHDKATKQTNAKVGRPETKKPTKVKGSVVDLAKRIQAK